MSFPVLFFIFIKVCLWFWNCSSLSNWFVSLIINKNLHWTIQKDWDWPNLGPTVSNLAISLQNLHLYLQFWYHFHKRRQLRDFLRLHTIDLTKIASWEVLTHNKMENKTHFISTNFLILLLKSYIWECVQKRVSFFLSQIHASKFFCLCV